MKATFLAAALAASVYLEVGAIPLAQINAAASLNANNNVNADINANVNLNGGRRPAATPVAQADVDAKVGSHPDKQRVKSHEHDHEDDDTEDGSVLDADAKLRLGNVADANVKAKVGGGNSNDDDDRGNLADVQAKAKVGNLADVDGHVKIGGSHIPNNNNHKGDSDVSAKAQVKKPHHSVPAVKANANTKADANLNTNEGDSPLVNIDLGKPDPNSGLNVGNLLHLGLGGNADDDNDNTRKHPKDFNGGAAARLGKPSHQKTTQPQHHGSLLDADIDNTLLDADVDVGDLAHVGLHAPPHSNDVKFKPGNNASKKGSNHNGGKSESDPFLDVGVNTGDLLPGVKADVGVGNVAHVAINDDHDSYNAKNGRENNSHGKQFKGGAQGKLAQPKNKGYNNGNHHDGLLDVGAQVGDLLGVHLGVGSGSHADGHSVSKEEKKQPHNPNEYHNKDGNKPHKGQHPGEPSTHPIKIAHPDHKDTTKNKNYSNDHQKDHKCAAGYHLDPHTKSCEKVDSLGRHRKHEGVAPNSAGKCPIDYKKHPFLNLCFSANIDLHIELGVSGPHHTFTQSGGCQGGYIAHPYLDAICIDSRIKFGLDVSKHDRRPDIYGACEANYRHHSSILDLCIDTTLDVDLGNNRIGRIIAEDELCTAGWRQHPDVAHLCVDSSINLGLFDSDRPTEADGSCPESYVIHPHVLDLCIDAKIAASLAHKRPKPMNSIPVKSQTNTQAHSSTKPKQQDNGSTISIGAKVAADILDSAAIHNVGAKANLRQIL